MMSPVNPLHMVSSTPNPHLINSSTAHFALTLRKGVASIKFPFTTPKFDMTISKSQPTVMRPFMQCRFIMTSVRIPAFGPFMTNGISSSFIKTPIVPFWPCRELSLSPSCGHLVVLARIRTVLMPSFVVDTITLSMINVSESSQHMITDLSRRTSFTLPSACTS